MFFVTLSYFVVSKFVYNLFWDYLSRINKHWVSNSFFIYLVVIVWQMKQLFLFFACLTYALFMEMFPFIRTTSYYNPRLIHSHLQFLIFPRFKISHRFRLLPFHFENLAFFKNSLPGNPGLALWLREREKLVCRKVDPARRSRKDFPFLIVSRHLM